ncbi:MAG: undecaprenyldiphospho-muramoylpentapeptide beta-N-acetylglucosaminyltransferase [Candidatus Marinimicrobia bacterium]|nr:undecaprenyldiphospho-muramoylpentapeptide beta-N-acetylglucosaminyltransferase [Candidatus Neomarinimicrobiota bacterium]
MNILIAGGGTGGHLFPALAIGNEWKKRHNDCIVHYVGSTFGIEASLLPNQNVTYTLLPIRGLQRGLSFRSVGRNLLLPWRLFVSYYRAKRLFNRISPLVVIGTGGYASALPVKIAIQKGIPVVLQEQNSFPGLTTRMFAERAEKVCLGFETTTNLLNTNTVFTGNPVRYSQPEGNRILAAETFNLNPNMPTVFLTGGSQGSAILNHIMNIASSLFVNAGIQVLWQTGKHHFSRYQSKDNESIRVLPFIEDMALAYSISDTIISRAGAIALAELAVWGKPSVLVPLHSAAGDHQRKNAEAMATVGASIMIEEPHLTPEKLFSLIKQIISDKDRISEMSKAAKSMSKPEATSHIVDIIEEIARV